LAVDGETAARQVISGNREYGPTALKIQNIQNALLAGISTQLKVWMSHGDEVVSLPSGFSCLASTKTVAAGAVANQEKRLYGLQFHPEVEHTQEGIKILQNFVQNICQLAINPRVIDIEEILEKIRQQANIYGEQTKAIAAVSGGVDSTVASALVAKAIGNRFIPVFCHNGLMRLGTEKEVEAVFDGHLGVKPVILDCRQEFLQALKGVIDPEQKRQIIGNLYIKNLSKQLKIRIR
jgi:GMP synthase (glutamine-hydrolysing)